MKFEISNQLAEWLRKNGRDDLASLGEIELTDVRYLEVFAEAREQHPSEETTMLRDRALFRVLTHPEWAPTRKQAAKEEAKQKAVWEHRLNWAWKIAILILLLLGLFVGRARGQEKPPASPAAKPKVVYTAQGKEPIRAEPQAPKPSAAPADVPELTAEQKFKIRDLQHRYDELRLQLAKLELEKMKIEKQLGDVLSSINGLAYDLAREAKVDTNRWNLNIDTLKWEKRP